MHPIVEHALDNPHAFAGFILAMACLACALLFTIGMTLQEWQDNRRHRARMVRFRARAQRRRARYL